MRVSVVALDLSLPTPPPLSLSRQSRRQRMLVDGAKNRIAPVNTADTRTYRKSADHDVIRQDVKLLHLVPGCVVRSRKSVEPSDT